LQEYYGKISNIELAQLLQRFLQMPILPKDIKNLVRDRPLPKRRIKLGKGKVPQPNIDKYHKAIANKDRYERDGFNARIDP
jgi:hypothetical protein